MRRRAAFTQFIVIPLVLAVVIGVLHTMIFPGSGWLAPAGFVLAALIFGGLEARDAIKKGQPE